MLGERHPETITSLANLPFNLHNLGRLAEAELLNRRALTLRTVRRRVYIRLTAPLNAVAQMKDRPAMWRRLFGPAGLVSQVWTPTADDLKLLPSRERD